MARAVSVSLSRVCSLLVFRQWHLTNQNTVLVYVDQSELRTHIKWLICTNQSSELLPCLHWLHGHRRESCSVTPGMASTTVPGAWTPQSHLRQGWACSLWWRHLCSGASWWTPGCRDASCGYQCTQGHYHHHCPPSWISWGLCSWKTCPHAPEPHCLWSKHPPEESGTCQRHWSHSLQFKVINSRLSLIVQIDPQYCLGLHKYQLQDTDWDHADSHKSCICSLLSLEHEPENIDQSEDSIWPIDQSEESNSIILANQKKVYKIILTNQNSPWQSGRFSDQWVMRTYFILSNLLHHFMLGLGHHLVLISCDLVRCVTKRTDITWSSSNLVISNSCNISVCGLSLSLSWHSDSGCWGPWFAATRVMECWWTVSSLLRSSSLSQQHSRTFLKSNNLLLAPMSLFCLSPVVPGTLKCFVLESVSIHDISITDEQGLSHKEQSRSVCAVLFS